MPDKKTTTFTGRVADILVDKPNGWRVIRLAASEINGRPTNEDWTLTGEMFVYVGDKVFGEGVVKWDSWQRVAIDVKKIRVLDSFISDKDSLRQFLLKEIKGIGPKTADKLLRRFDLDELVRELDNTGAGLLQVVGPRTADKIWKSWSQKRGNMEADRFLYSNGLTSVSYRRKVIRSLGQATISVVTRFPYKLLQYHILFGTVDSFALKLGIKPEDDRRIMAGILYMAYQRTDGSTYITKDVLQGMTAAQLKLDHISDTQYERCLTFLERADRIKVAGDRVFAARLYYAETSVARRLLDLRDLCSVRIAKDQVDAFIKVFESKNPLIQLTDSQCQAIYRCALEGVTIVTGGPGTGKTTIVKTMVELFNSMDYRVSLCAPTGRSAQRLKESSGHEAQTIHRLLEVIPMDGGHSMVFRHNENDPLLADVVIVDEVSMVDVELASHLLRALRDGSKLILIGDKDQLPSIGPGNVLHDSLHSGCIPAVELLQIFRQSGNSRIIVNARKINSGETDLESGKDFFWDKRVEWERIEKVVSQRIPKKFGIDRRDVIIITPFRRKFVSINVNRINEEMQQKFNPPANNNGKTIEARYGDKTFRSGDPVIQTENNYDKDVFNGDLGRVTHAESDFQGRGYVVVEFSGRGAVSYIESDLRELDLAYGISVHRSQGSEYKAVVIILPDEYKAKGMLKRNLFYTAVTRATDLCVLFASQRAVRAAVSDASYSERRTMLAELLQQDDLHRKARINKRR